MRVLVSCSRLHKVGPYLEALKAAGVQGGDLTVLTPADAARPDLATLAATADGLLLTGGDDVEPWRYGETPHPGIDYELLPDRDQLEVGLFEGARRARVPVLGVCRGLQFVNAALGGTLWHDLPSERPSEVPHALRDPLDLLAHPIETVPGETPLHAWLGRFDAARVNSRHHQGVRDLAPGLEAAALAPDGLVEALVGADPRWFLEAVQWHPENLQALAAAQHGELHRGLFRRFVETIRARCARRTAEVETL
jgi:putative glutamine amidotransferase